MGGYWCITTSMPVADGTPWWWCMNIELPDGQVIWCMHTGMAEQRDTTVNDSDAWMFELWDGQIEGVFWCMNASMAWEGQRNTMVHELQDGWMEWVTIWCMTQNASVVEEVIWCMNASMAGQWNTMVHESVWTTGWVNRMGYYLMHDSECKCGGTAGHNDAWALELRDGQIEWVIWCMHECLNYGMGDFRIEWVIWCMNMSATGRRNIMMHELQDERIEQVI